MMFSVEVVVFVASALGGALVGAVATLYAATRVLRGRLAAAVDEFQLLGAVVAREEQQTRAAVKRLTEVVVDSSQAWFWTPDWQEGERRADEDLAAGRTVAFDSFDDMETYLDKVPLPDGVRT